MSGSRTDTVSPTESIGETDPTGTSDSTQRLIDRYEEMATLAGGLAHEIRNPLSTISLNLELLQEDLEDSENQRDRRMLRKIELVRRECDHLEETLNAFLRFTRAQKAVTEPTDLNAVVRDFIAFYEPQAEEAGMQLSPHLAIDLPPVELDRTAFKQVLMNLARNAANAMPDGGTLELQTHRVGDQVHLAIIDTGIGMTPETQSRIFDAFFSNSPGGSGLGLPTVRKIIEAHGGTVTCESELNRGTQFLIQLPILSDA